MTIDLREHITVRMFIGCLISSDLKYLLSQSLPWKNYQIVCPTEGHKLKEIQYQGKGYLGYFIDESGSTLSEIEELEQQIQNKIKTFCADFGFDKLKCYVFPQIFVS